MMHADVGATFGRVVRRTVPVIMGGAAALVVVACSGGSPSKATSTSTIATTAAAATSTSAAAVAGTTTTSLPTSLAPGQTSPSVPASGATTTAAGRVVSSPSNNVRLGDSGAGVKQIQTALVAQGYKVAVDGRFGPQTSQAVKDFQKKNGLTQDGVVGPITWAKLQARPSTSTTTKGSTTTTTKGSTTTTH